MPSFRTLTVVEEIERRPGLQRVRLHDGSRAYALVDLVGDCAIGDEVVVNTTAVELGLGTGGWHVVHWNLARRSLVQPGGGHIMKVRYTSLQLDAGSAEERGAPSTPLAGRPVIVGSLHSQLGVVLGVVAATRPDLRVGYVMTDGAALPIALSDLAATARAKGFLHVTVTAGHAFGGDLEAVSVASALELAAGAGADVIVVAMGPGVVGTGTRLGTTAVEVASILDLVAALGGTPFVAVRASNGDGRDRHQGISHHTVTALELCHTPVSVALPLGPDHDELASAVPSHHRVVRVPIDDVGGLLERVGLTVTTMGRGPDRDPLFFQVTGAAAVAAMAAIRSGSPGGTVPAR